MKDNGRLSNKLATHKKVKIIQLLRMLLHVQFSKNVEVDNCNYITH